MAPLIGTWCGNDSPGEIIASNPDGALTFKFHSDGSVTAAGWEAQLACTSTVSIGEIETKVLHLWPNPASDRLIHIENGESIQEVSIVDATGELVYQSRPMKKEAQLMLSSLPAGIYMVRIADGKQITSRKLVLQ